MNLEKFHKGCVKEHKEILKSFNILYYGFGCKKTILSEMYPDALLFDMNYYKVSDIIYELNKKLKKNYKSISDFNSTKTLILIDFDFKNTNLFLFSKFKLIFTLEKINTNLTYQNILDLNLVMRDLTTFQSYDVNLIQSTCNLEGHLNVIRNVNKNSKFTFCSLLQFNKKIVPLIDLFNKIKKVLMIVNKSRILDFLREFVDHNIIKIQQNQDIEIIVDIKYFKDLIAECEK